MSSLTTVKKFENDKSISSPLYENGKGGEPLPKIAHREEKK